MRQRKKESGRSMIEVIAVICLIILLLVASIYGANKVHAKIQAKSVTERVITLRDQRRLQNFSKAGKNIHQEEGPFGTTLTIENGIGERNKTYFWIIVNKDSSDFCSEMSKADVGAMKIDSEDCPEETVFYFDKYPEASGGGDPDRKEQPTITCDAGYQDSEPTCDDNQKVVSVEKDGMSCYKCDYISSCSEKTGYQDTACTGLQVEENSFELDASTMCYKCKDMTTCTEKTGYQETACAKNQKEDDHFTLGGTTCYKCSDLTECTQKTGYQKGACDDNQNPDDSFTLADGMTDCYMCSNFTACSQKTGYQETTCSNIQKPAGSFTLAGTTTHCYKCENLTSCTQKTGYQETTCSANQNPTDSITLANTKVCYKCENLTSCTQKTGYQETTCATNQKPVDTITLVDGTTKCYKCENMTTCESPWASTVTCYPGETRTSITLANNKVCYQCTGTADTDCDEGYQTTACDDGFDDDSYTLKNGTVCHLCSCDDDNTCGTECCGENYICGIEDTCVACPVPRNFKWMSNNTSRYTCTSKCENTEYKRAYNSDKGTYYYKCIANCPDAQPLWGHLQGTSADDACIRCPNYDETIIQPNTEEGMCTSNCTNAEETYDANADSYLCTGTCPTSTPLYNGTQCVACPTIGNDVTLTKEGLCEEVCGGIETYSNGKYICEDASGICYQKMVDAGYNTSKFTVSGKVITYTDSNTMEVGDDLPSKMNKVLDLSGCDLTLTQRGLEISEDYTLKVDNLTSSDTSGDKAIYNNAGTINASGNIVATATSGVAIYNYQDGVITASGTITGTSDSSFGIQVDGNMTASQITGISTSGVGVYIGRYLTSELTIRGNLTGESTKSQGIYIDYLSGNLTVTGDMIGTNKEEGYYTYSEGIKIEDSDVTIKAKNMTGTSASDTGISFESGTIQVTKDITGTTTDTESGIYVGDGVSISAKNIYGECQTTSYGGEGIHNAYGSMTATNLIQGKGYHHDSLGIKNWGSMSATTVKGIATDSAQGIMNEGSSAVITATTVYGEGFFGVEIRTGGTINATYIKGKVIYPGEDYDYAGVLDCTPSEGGSVVGEISTIRGEGALYNYSVSGSYSGCKCNGISYTSGEFRG